jgi:FkbM family methyltransferase
MKKTLIVSGADSNYFTLLHELCLSFDALGGFDRYEFAVLNLGLDESQTDILQALGVRHVVAPGWPFAGLENQPQWYKAIVCRPFLPRLIPGYDHYVWVDADSWFQHLDGLSLALQGADQCGFAVVPVCGQAYWHPAAARTPAQTLAWQRDSLESGFGGELADELFQRPIIGAGFVSGRADAPHWHLWQQLIASALSRKVYFSAEQSALNVLVYKSGLPVSLLPGSCYWNVHLGVTGWAIGSAMLTDPSAPAAAHAIIGLSAEFKNSPLVVHADDGRLLAISPRYSGRGSRHRLRLQLGENEFEFAGIAPARFRERWLASLSRQRRVRFLQIGAMDGVAFDPIHALVKRYRWQGVLVEPNPHMMSRLQANYRSVPDLSFVEAAIADGPGVAKLRRLKSTLEAEEVAPVWARGLATLAPERNAISGLGISQEEFDKFRPHLEDIEVKTVTYAGLVETTGQSVFDVIVIDTEGYDFKVLQQIDLVATGSCFVQFEVANLPASEIGEALNLLARSGFASYLSDDRMDVIAIRE